MQWRLERETIANGWDTPSEIVFAWWGLFKMINAKSLMWPCPRVRQTRMGLWIRKTECGFIKIQLQLHLQPTIHIALYLGEKREWKKKEM